MGSLLRLSYVWLFVKDRSRSFVFYRDLLGFQVLQEFPDGALFDVNGIRLGIHQEEADGFYQAKPGGIVLTLQTERLHETFQELEKRGVVFSRGIVQEPYGKIARLQDPDGYPIELFEESFS